MISFGVWKYVFVISDFFLLICNLLWKHTATLRKVGLMFAATVHVLNNVTVFHLYGPPHLRWVAAADTVKPSEKGWVLNEELEIIMKLRVPLIEPS